MAARKPTWLSRVSVGWHNSSDSLRDYDAGDTGTVFSVTGPAVITGALTQTGDQAITGALTVSSTASIGGALTQTGAATFSSTISSAGTITGTGSVIVGAGTAITKVLSSLMSVGGAQIVAFDSATSNYLNNNAAVGDVVVLTPSSKWSGAYGDLNFYGQVSTASTVQITINNSTGTAITPDAMNWRCTLIRF